MQLVTDLPEVKVWATLVFVFRSSVFVGFPPEFSFFHCVSCQGVGKLKVLISIIWLPSQSEFFK